MKICVVTPSFNQGIFIQRTLESVAAQRQSLPTDIALEHLVYDGGSTDDTVAILSAFTPKVQWVSAPDKGQADAVNQGILATDADIIGWLNSDDVYYPDALHCIATFFTTHPDVDIVYGMADHIDREDKPFETYPTEPWSLERLKETCIICQPALFFRKKIIDKHGVLDESLHYAMDYEFWLRLAKAGVAASYLPQKLAGSRMYGDNKTLKYRVKAHAEINDVFLKLFGLVPDTWLYHYAHKVAEDKIDRQTHPRLFVLSLITVATIAALRWNKRLFPTVKIPWLVWSRALFTTPFLNQ